MPFVPVNNVAMVEMRCLRNGQKIENRVMVDLFAEPTPELLEDVAIVCWNWWENEYAPLLHTEVHLTEVVATSQHEADGPQFTYAPDTTTNGTMGGFALPNEVSYCVSLRSAFRGRSARGRFYTLSISDAQLEDTNTMTGAAADALTSAVQILISDLNTAGYKLIIVSYRTNNAPRVGGPVKFIVQSAVSADLILDSQRRRKPGVGE